MKPVNKKIYLLIALAFLILLGGGATFIFNKLLHLDNYKGEILADGEPTSVVSRYHQLVFEREGKDRAG